MMQKNFKSKMNGVFQGRSITYFNWDARTAIREGKVVNLDEIKLVKMDQLAHGIKDLQEILEAAVMLDQITVSLRQTAERSSEELKEFHGRVCAQAICSNSEEGENMRRKLKGHIATQRKQLDGLTKEFAIQAKDIKYTS